MGGEDGQGQTRAAGITRAILDTFPVVKFGHHNGSAITMGSAAYMCDQERKTRDEEAIDLPNRNEFLQVQPRLDAPSDDSHIAGTLASLETPNHQSSLASQSRGPEATGTTSPSDIDPAAIGTETCPICILDFEEGDDIRVLPCDEKHRFHKDCVDPWLLELSSSCPICREGLSFMRGRGVSNF
jgi:Ring finger domain